MFDILAVGELNVDVILTGLKQPPIFGREILAESYTECLGSSTAICACVAASLGASVVFCGRVGADAHGRLVRASLEKYGVDTRAVRQKESWRTGVTVSLSTSEDRAMVTYLGDTIDATVSEDVDFALTPARHMHVGSFFLQTRLKPGLASLFRRAHALGMTTSLDAGWDENARWQEYLPDVLRETDYFFPNESEAAAISGKADPESGARDIVRYGCTVVVKCGADGALLCTPGTNAQILRQNAYRTHVVDTTGAGDSFNAGFLFARLRGLSLAECMQYGCATGAVSVTRTGGTTCCPTLPEILRTQEAGTVL